MNHMMQRTGFAIAAIVLAPIAFAQDSFNDAQGQQQGYPQQQQQGSPQQQQQGSPQQQQRYPQQQQQGQQQPAPQQRYPQQPAAGNQGYSQPPQGQQGGMRPPNFAAAAQMENEDFGVQPVSILHAGEPHGPTPTTIPGGKVISTQQLAMQVTQNPRGMAVLDILGGSEMLPMATFATPAASPGSFNDEVQKNFGAYLQKVTGGNKAMPVVAYCLNPHCWLSYNAALRAINMGYTHVLWYRGGIEAWQAAGLPLASQNGNSSQESGR